jgi:hypothetical protein
MLRHQKNRLGPGAEEQVGVGHLARTQNRLGVRESIQRRLKGVHRWRHSCQVTR